MSYELLRKPVDWKSSYELYSNNLVFHLYSYNKWTAAIDYYRQRANDSVRYIESEIPFREMAARL